MDEYFKNALFVIGGACTLILGFLSAKQTVYYYNHYRLEDLSIQDLIDQQKKYRNKQVCVSGLVSDKDSFKVLVI